MASELIVQTLKGPTSGANANKIIVPSGQTLEVDGITGLAGGNIRNVIDHSFTPSTWSYSNSSTAGASIHTQTFSLPSRSLLICQTQGHCSNTANANTLIAIGIDGDKAGAQGYPYYAGDAYYTGPANNNTWSHFSHFRMKEVAAGSHSVELLVSGDGGAHTNYINGWNLKIFALELI